MKWFKSLMSFFGRAKYAPVAAETAAVGGAGTAKSLSNATKTVENAAKAERTLVQEVRTQQYYDNLNLQGTWYNPRSGNTLTSNGNDSLYVFSGNAAEHGFPTRQLGGEIQLQTHLKFLDNGNLRVTRRTPGKNVANGLGESNSTTWLYDFNSGMRQQVTRMSSQTSTSCGYAI